MNNSVDPNRFLFRPELKMFVLWVFCISIKILAKANMFKNCNMFFTLFLKKIVENMSFEFVIQKINYFVSLDHSNE